jgi:hypothetical protein
MRRVAIVHGALPHIPDADMKIYLEILRDSIIELKASNTISLEVIFPKSAKSKVDVLLNNKLEFAGRSRIHDRATSRS